MTDRGPLRFIVLAATGQDVGQCTACEGCYVDEATAAGFDLDLWEALAAVCGDEATVLTSHTILSLAEARPEDVGCLNGLDLVAVARALRREACLRGLTARGVHAKREAMRCVYPRKAIA